MKKEAIILIFVFGTLFSINAFADDGCCINPTSSLVCSTEAFSSRDTDCCPLQASFPQYYKSTQNPNNPADYADCAKNFFFNNTDCGLVDACKSTGCCCSQFGWDITSEPKCKGTGQIFHKGVTDCNQICAIPQCSDGKDNDNNNCIDYSGGDTGCFGPEDTLESGGICSGQATGCNNPNYAPKLTNLEITPVKGERKFLLKWQDECSENSAFYEVSRCTGAGCTNFALVAATNTNSFEDASGDLLFDTTYTYHVKARYKLQTATPSITQKANLGNIECWSQFSSDNFCVHESYYTRYQNYLVLNFPDSFKNFAEGVKSRFETKFNKAYSCDSFNKLTEKLSCSSTNQVCIVTNHIPSCLPKSSCKPAGSNPFGMFYTLETCESNNYCFYDRSHSTIDSCFGCNPSMSCYDYRTEGACTRDNCRVGSCRWKNLESQIGIGMCVSTVQTNCQWCEIKGTKSLENLRAFNEIFDFCTKEKSDALSEGAFRCYFSKSRSKSCDSIVCTDYETSQCGTAAHDINNIITNTIADECSLKVCQNFNGKCAKNSDGDNKQDCATSICENDYFAPNTTLLQVIKKGVTENLIVQIYDKSGINSSSVLKTSKDYSTFLCVEPCGSQGHQYDTSTTSRMIIISNLNAYDSDTKSKLLAFKEGENTVRYYSQDPSKNIGEVKKIKIQVYSNTTGPRVFAANVSDGTKILDRIYTSNQEPAIEIQFYEPATVVFARLVDKKTQQTTASFQPKTELSDKAIFQVANTLPNGEYTFELNAKNDKNIPMDPPLAQVIVIDNTKPTLVIEPANGTIINKSSVPIKLAFDKEMDRNSLSVKLNSEEIKDKFATTNNKVFDAAINMPDGSKRLDVEAKDYSKNFIQGTSQFVVDANPTLMRLVNPKFGISPKYTFDIAVETDNDAECRYSLDTIYEYNLMEKFPLSGGTIHNASNFNKIASGDTGVHKLHVKCKDRRGESLKSFDISVDQSPPMVKNAFAYPNPVVEEPPATALTMESDEPVICKFSTQARQFDGMEGKFEGFDNSTFKAINKQQVALPGEGKYTYYTACKNKAGLESATSNISVNVNFTIAMDVKSHTPEFFNSTNVVLAVETNKNAQCQFSETDTTARSGELFGPQGYAHTKNVISTHGKHTFYVVCKDLKGYSDVKTISFVVDLTKPLMLFVNDSYEGKEKTCLTDRLRVKWLGKDDDSGIKEYVYFIIKKANNQQIVSLARSFIGGEWLWVENLSLEDNTNYYFRASAKNYVGLESESKESNGVTTDTLSCRPKPVCGDSMINQPGEECDLGAFGSINRCTQYTNFIGGTLKCASDCRLDPSECVKAPSCGNGAIDTGEACDGNSFGKIKTCSDYSPSLTGGNLKCTSCQLDTTSCTEAPKCGNNFIDKGESCDSANLGPLNGKCVDYSAEFNSGSMKCADCKLDTSGCAKAQACGNNKLDTGELCDGTNFGNITDLSCSKFSPNFINGTLACKSCKVKTDDCRTNSTLPVLITCRDRGDCKLNEPCSDNSDCEGRFCSGGKCVQAGCSDGIKNQGETDIDCGGPCGKCPNGRACNTENDCQSNSCSFGFCRQQESCFNGKFNPGETDIDCGGPCPSKCPEGRNCNLDRDCEQSMKCISSSCKSCGANDNNCNGIPDDEELSGIKDTDKDGLPDEWEIENGLNPNDPSDADTDSDNDGLTNREEFDVKNTYARSTDPNKDDTDEDGFKDKDEIDKGTNPVDSEDFPKSSMAKIIMFSLGILVLLSGIGYLAYQLKMRKGEKHELPKHKEAPRLAPQPQMRQAPQRRKEEDARLEALKRREELKEKEREKLFEAFGREKEPESAKAEKQEALKAKKPIAEKADKSKKRPKKPKEDVFVRLKEIAKEAKKKKSKRKNAKK